MHRVVFKGHEQRSLQRESQHREVMGSVGSMGGPCWALWSWQRVPRPNPLTYWVSLQLCHNPPGTKSTIDGEDFYGAYDAQDSRRSYHQALACPHTVSQETGKKYSAELGVTVTHYENMAALAYCSHSESMHSSVATCREYGAICLYSFSHV